ncbi:MAG: hypothetical protein ACFFGZ_01425 [Candidatus Thorarchaeota archaeon]
MEVFPIGYQFNFGHTGTLIFRLRGNNHSFSLVMSVFEDHPVVQGGVVHPKVFATVDLSSLTIP